jgi:hypothetical protein
VVIDYSWLETIVQVAEGGFAVGLETYGRRIVADEIELGFNRGVVTYRIPAGSIAAMLAPATA